jgi:hypothetical protein
MKKTVDYYNAILALPALYPYPPTDENTTGGPSSKYPLHNHRKKKVWNNASMWDFIPGVCMKKWNFFSKTKFHLLDNSSASIFFTELIVAYMNQTKITC